MSLGIYSSNEGHIIGGLLHGALWGHKLASRLLHFLVVSPIIPCQNVDPGGPVVIILATGSEVRGFKPGRGQWIFLERKNPGYDFLRKGSKAVGPVS